MKFKSFTTDSQLKAITLPQDTKELIIKDESTPNLIVRIRPNSKTFIFRIKINGKIKKYTIGQYPLISLATARQEAIRLKNQITQGIDPTLKELTFNEVAQRWLKHKSKQNLATFKKIQGRLNNHIIPKLGNIKIQDLKRDKLIKCVLELELKDNRGDGFETKTKIFGILKEILKFIAIHGLIHDYISPLADLNFGDICKDKHTTTHHRYIQEPKRLKEFLDAIENYKGNILTKYALKMGVYTALRSQTLRTLKWEYIDYTKDIINIPKEQMKTKKPFILPLTNQIKAILKELEPYKLGQYLFSINSNVMSDGTLTKAIKRMGFRDDTDFHGLRGLFSTICNEHTQEHGLSAEIIELCLAHADTNQIRSAYNHSERLSEKAKLMKWYNDYIDKIKGMR